MSHSQPMSAFCSVYNLCPHSSQLFRKNSFYFVSFLPFFSYFHLFLRTLPPVDTSSQPSLCHCPFQDAPQSKPLDSVDLLVYLIPRFGVLQFPTQFPCFLKYLHPPMAFIESHISLPLLAAPRVGSVLALVFLQNFTHLNKFRHTPSSTCINMGINWGLVNKSLTHTASLL